MNLLCLDQFSEIGGGQRSLLDLLPEFCRKGWSPLVVIPGAGSLACAVHDLGFPTEFLDCGRYASGSKGAVDQVVYAARLLPQALRLRTLLHSRDIDLIYVNAPRLLPSAALATRFMDIPIVFHCHNRLQQTQAAAMAGIALRLSRARMIACCRYVTEPLNPLVDKGQWRIIFNGVESVAQTRRSGLHRPTRIGVVGRIESEKGQLEFVKAARWVAERHPECKFVVAGAPQFSGDSYFKQVVQESAGLPVTFTGWQVNIAQIYEELDLLVVPSTPLEATTRVILEAYSAGIPVVAFPNGGIPEIVVDEVTGFLAADGTPEALANRVLSVLQMAPESLAQVTRRANQHWRERFQLSAYRRSVCDVLDEAVGIRRFEPEFDRNKEGVVR